MVIELKQGIIQGLCAETADPNLNHQPYFLRSLHNKGFRRYSCFVREAWLWKSNIETQELEFGPAEGRFERVEVRGSR